MGENGRVVLSVKLGRFVCVMLGMQMVSMRDMGVMCGLFVIARLMVLGGFFMVLSGVVVMLSRALVVLGCIIRWHVLLLHRRGSGVSWRARLDDPATSLNATSIRLRADETARKTRRSYCGDDTASGLTTMPSGAHVQEISRSRRQTVGSEFSRSVKTLKASRFFAATIAIL